MQPSDSFAPQSLFDQKLDRAVLVSYFLGAVVPLLALGMVVVRYALPGLEDGLGGLELRGLAGANEGHLEGFCISHHEALESRFSEFRR